MKTKVKKTSIEAYKKINVFESRKKILNALKRVKSSCIADLAAKLNMEKSSVSARLNELYKAGMIAEAGEKKSQTTRIKAHFWKVA